MLLNKINSKLKKVIATTLIFAVFASFLPTSANAFLDPKPEPVKNSDKAPIIERTKLVAFLVGEELLDHPDLASKIERYGQDVQRALRAKVVQIPVPYEASPFEIYEGLGHLYFSGLDSDQKSQLVGTVLIGDVPLPVIEKNGNFWPTIFPYVDFKAPIYHWKTDKEQFVHQGGDGEPEIWHGVIRSGADGIDYQVKELEEYFDENHKVHAGETTFSQKVFFADFNRQKRVVSDLIFNHYLRWIRYAEDISYLRFTKRFAKKLFDEFAAEKKAMGISTGDVSPADALEDMNDILSKPLADTILKRYQEIYSNWFASINGMIDKSARWTPTDIDTTVSMISRKDEYAVLTLRAVNDAVEEALISKMEVEQIPVDISVTTTEDVQVQETDEFGNLVVDATTGDPVFTTEGAPLYWNGVRRDAMTAEDCSLSRGSKNGDQTPFAQRLESNRTFNSETVGSCADENASDQDKNDDLYEGCCVDNMVDSNGELSYVRCDTGSEWMVVDNTSVHLGAELPVFSVRGTAEKEIPQGAEGCVDIIEWGGGDRTFSSLFIHDEPRNETISDQLAGGSSQLLPVDDPRGFSYYDHYQNFRRIAFPNIFDFRASKLAKTDLKSAILALFREKIDQINEGVDETKTISQEKLSEDLLDEELEKIGWEKIYDALMWLDKDIEEKNKLILETAFSEPEKYQNFLFDDDFDGYELVEIISKGHPIDGLEMSFAPVGSTTDEEYFDVLDQLLDFEFDPDPFVGFDFSSEGEVEEVAGEAVRLEIFPSEFRIPVTDPSLVRVEARLKDRKENIVESDFETEVTLKFSSSDVSRFFTIMGSQTKTVRAGKATFMLIPKVEQKIAGKFQVFAEAGKFTAEPVPMSISTHSISLVPPVDPIEVRQNGGVLFRAEIQGLDRKLSVAMDGKTLKFESDEGTFEGGNTAVIENGIVSIRFYPGEKAGRGKIMVSDFEKELPFAEAEFDIFPGPPAVLRVDAPRFLIKEADFVPVSIQITDEYGNKIDRLKHTISWNFDRNIEVQNFKEKDNSAGEKGLQEFVSGGDSEIFIRTNLKGRKKAEIERARMQIYSDALPADYGRSVAMKVIHDPVFDVDLKKTKGIVAGTEEPLRIPVKAETWEGKTINDDFEVLVTAFPDDIGHFPSELKLVDGVGELPFFPGIKAGKVKLTLARSGFVDKEIELEVVSDEAKKIIISTNEETIDLAQESPILLDVKAVDRFGNTVQNHESVAVHVTSATSDLLRLESGTVTLKDGKGVLKGWPTGKSGEVHIVVEKEGAIPDALELTATSQLSTEEIRKFSPKSLFSLILGFAAGDVRWGRNFANQLLFSGQTQAIGTLAADLIPAKRLFSIAPDGKIFGGTEAELLPGKFPEVVISSAKFDNQSSIRTRFLFKNEVGLLFNKSKKEQAGVYFNCEKDECPDIEQKNSSIVLNGNELFSVTESGGINFDPQKLIFKPTENLRKWQVFSTNELVGMLEFVIDEDLYFIDRFLAEGEPGILIKPLSSEIGGDEVFITNTTHSEKGLAITLLTEKEKANRKLGSSQTSVEDALGDDTVGWVGNWKAGINFAAGNSIGDSVKWGSGDNFILLGDPSLSVERNPGTDFGFSQDMGTLTWKSPDGPIEQILSADINGDENEDLLVRVGEKLFGLYQAKNPLEENLVEKKDTNLQVDPNFYDAGPVLRFADEAQTLISLDNDRDDFTDLIQLNAEGKLIVHKNQAGTFFREDLNLTEDKIMNLKLGELNGDLYQDLVFATEKNDLFIAFGHEAGFFKPKLLDNFSPDFQEVEEEFTPFDAEIKAGDLIQTYPHLGALLISFMGIDSIEADLDEEIITRFPDPEKPGKEVDLSEFFNSEKKEKVFMPVIRNERFDTEFTAKIDKETNKIEIGDKILVKFTIKANSEIKNFEFQPGTDERLKFIPGSLRCEGCKGNLELRKEQGQGNFWAHGVDLPGIRKVIFSWELEVTEVSVINFLLGDFEDGADDADDVVVPWDGSDGVRRLIKFLSSEQPPLTGLRAGDLGGSIIAYAPKKRIDAVQPPKEDTYEERYENPMESDTDNDGIPDSHDHYPHTPNEAGLDYSQNYLVEVANQKENWQCGGGECYSFVPAVAEDGPGLINDMKPYQPTVAEGPYQPKDPCPWDTCENEEDDPFDGLETQDGDATLNLGIYRYYEMEIEPNEPKKEVEANCYGLKSKHMEAPIWWERENCWLEVTTPYHDLDICRKTGVEELNAEAAYVDRGSVGSLYNTSGPRTINGVFTMKMAVVASKENMKNIQIPAGDVVALWLQDQMREFGSNLSLPSLSVQMPSYLRHYMREAVPPEFQMDRGGVIDLIYSALLNIPFLEVNVEDVSIPYVNFTQAEMGRWENQYKEWRKTAPAKFSPAELQRYDSAFENNRKAIHAYNDLVIKELINIRRKQAILLDGLIEILHILSDYLDEWVAHVERGLDHWQEAERIMLRTLQNVWQKEIIQPFVKFSLDCRTCVIDRGTLLMWVLKHIFMVEANFEGDDDIYSVEFPLNVIRVPRAPDIKIDYSNVGGRFSVTLLNPMMKPMDLTLFELFPLPVESGDEMLPFSLPPFPGSDLDVPALNYRLPTLLKSPSSAQEITDLKAADVYEPEKHELPEKIAKVLEELKMPAIPEPPKLPEILDSLRDIVRRPKELMFPFLCDLRRGLWWVPEWFVKPHAEQLANRETLFESGERHDYSILHLQKIGTRDPERYAADEDFVEVSDGYLLKNDDKDHFKNEVTMENIEWAGKSLDRIEDNISQRKRDEGRGEDVVPGEQGKEIETSYQPPFQEMKDLVQNLENANREAELLDAPTLLAQMKGKVRNMKPKNRSDYEMKKAVLGIADPDLNLDTPLRRGIKTHLAVKHDILDYLRQRLVQENKILFDESISSEEFFAHPQVQEILEMEGDYFTSGKNKKDFAKQVVAETESFLLAQTEGNEEESTEPQTSEVVLTSDGKKIQDGIYFLDPASNQSKKITKLASPNAQSLLIDLDGDDFEEMIYSFEDELYIKEFEAESKVELPVEEIEQMHFSVFQDFFAPTPEVVARVSATGVGLDFMRSDEDITYFEWVTTDRPDFLMEARMHPSRRKSKQWDRQAMLVRDPLSAEQSRWVSARVLSVTGNPKIHVPTFPPVPNVSAGDCKDPETPKPMFLEENVFMAQSEAKFRMRRLSGDNGKWEKITLFEGGEIKLPPAELCVTSGKLVRLQDGKMQEKELSAGQILTDGARLELGPEDRVKLKFFDGSQTMLWGGENYDFHQVSSAEKEISLDLPLRLGNHYGFLIGQKGMDMSYLRSGFLTDPQKEDDRSPPQIRIKGGSELFAPMRQKILVDATRTSDEQLFKKVWWDLYPKKDSDGDGDSTNDVDFPKPDSDYPIERLLKIKLPPRAKAEEFSVFLHVQDPAGNVTSQEIKITVGAPALELQIASMDEHQLSGKVQEKLAKVPVWFLRSRAGVEDLLREEPVLSDKSGRFELSGLSASGGLEIIDKTTGKVVVEVLENGRPVIIDNRFGFNVQPATTSHPFRIRIRDEKNHSVLFLDFSTSGEKPVVVASSFDSLSEAVQVMDRNAGDRFVFHSFPESSVSAGSVALVDNENHKTLGVLDPRGDFYLVGNSGIHFGVKRAMHEEGPVIFEIFGPEKAVVGELFIPVEGIETIKNL